MSELEREAIAVALALLADAVDDGNDHLLPQLSPKDMRALGERVKAGLA